MSDRPIKPDPMAEDELREKLIDKLDDQRFSDNVVNEKLLYKDVEWIVDELMPVIVAYTTNKIIEARIDELNGLDDLLKDAFEYDEDFWTPEILDRIEQLKTELKEALNHRKDKNEN